MKSIFLILFAVGGCTSYYAVDISSADQVDELNRLALKHGTAVVLANGTVVKAKNLHISPDTISWLDPETDISNAKRSSRISEIRVFRTSRGVMDGLAVGSASGASMLGIQAALVWVLQGEDSYVLNPITVPVIAVSGGVVGGLMGMAVGALRGHTDAYSVNYDSPIPQLESHPKEK